MTRTASGLSPEELSLIDAGNAGRQAGMIGTAAALNPYDHRTEEHAEWERCRMSVIGARIAGKLAA